MVDGDKRNPQPPSTPINSHPHQFALPQTSPALLSQQQQQFVYFPSPAVTPPAVPYQAPSYFVVPQQHVGHQPQFVPFAEGGQLQQHMQAAYMVPPAPMGTQYVPVAMVPGTPNMHNMMVPMSYQPMLYQQPPPGTPQPPYPMTPYTFPTVPTFAPMTPGQSPPIPSPIHQHFTIPDPQTAPASLPHSSSNSSIASNMFNTTMSPPASRTTTASSSRRGSLPPTTSSSPLARPRTPSFTISEDEPEPSSSTSPRPQTSPKPRRRLSKSTSNPFIPRPANSFIRYRTARHAQVMSENPALSNCELSKIIAKMWKEEDDDVKKRYEAEAREGRERHREMFPEYRYRPRGQGEIVRRPGRRKKRDGDEGGSEEGSPPAVDLKVKKKSPSPPVGSSPSPSSPHPNLSLSINIPPVEPATFTIHDPLPPFPSTQPQPSPQPFAHFSSYAYQPSPNEWDDYLSPNSEEGPLQSTLLDELNMGLDPNMFTAASFEIHDGGLIVAEEGNANEDVVGEEEGT
ncbi:hypothetical protein HK097_002916 [Rhizophlyctis rosea]|uniref:HMG box domain-containing protein n=1 Tax=Rhizophlyctis rosea TaxID=64517 RepID=A0AAD5X6E8_9FUNG|nr:hypothetical protein HK097_002916 [Rhizophlyctis rosea]